MGLFIAGEGGDGSGKGTQMTLLHGYVESLGYNTALESYPRYSQPIAEHVIRFLNGKYGNPHPELASVPYALDRLNAKPEIMPYIEDPNGVYLADRFTSSNLGHNGSKFDTPEERAEFFEFQRHFEYNILDIPKPDKNIILMVPAEVSQENIDKKAARDYTEKKRDIHEADLQHLKKTLESYKALAAMYPDEYELVDCMQTSTRMRTVEDIQDQLREITRGLLGIQRPV